tara:strand:- start:610 stop:933 length:324 start_codon:yes stop_codon:yes gene_type:complete
MSVDNYVFIVIGFEIEESEIEKYENFTDRKKGFNVERIYEIESDEIKSVVFGRTIKKYDEGMCLVDFDFALTTKDLEDEIDLTREMMEEIVDDIKDLKLHIVGGSSY